MKYMGVASGCGCKEVFPYNYYLSLLLLYLLFFAAASLLFVNNNYNNQWEIYIYI